MQESQAMVAQVCTDQTCVAVFGVTLWFVCGVFCQDAKSILVLLFAVLILGMLDLVSYCDALQC